MNNVRKPNRLNGHGTIIKEFTMKHWLEVESENQEIQEYKVLSEIVSKFENEIT